jgi:hypothetical protein
MSSYSALPENIVYTECFTPSTGDNFRVPRSELLTFLELAFQNEQLKISKDLPDVQQLIKELQNLRRRSPDSIITSHKSTMHDDLVFATALATWRAATTWQNMSLPRLP